jgi:hydroxypyruvate reductase
VEGISLDDMREMTEVMLASGATINEVNTLRKRLDLVKGGGIAEAVNLGHLMTLILSDVVGDDLDAIASGPTVPDSSSFDDVREILEKYELTPMLPDSVLEHFVKGLSGEVEDTPFADNQIFDKNSVHLVGNLKIAANAAKEQAIAEGFHANIASTSYQGEARTAGDRFVTVMREMSERGIPLPRPACLIFGGETTVTLRGNGKGGRNQEMALSAVKGMSGLKNCMLVTLATDGGDGPTDAAGAVVVPDTLARSEAVGLDVTEFLANNDAYHFFEALGDLLKPGPTQTNVNDLAFLFCFEN